MPIAVAQAARGCDEVYHVAADYRLWVLDPAPMYATNVEGTRNVLAAAHRRQGPPRRPHQHRRRARNSARRMRARGLRRCRSATWSGPYKRSKFLAEQAALEAAREGVPVVIVNPSTPIGALDYKPTPTGRIIVDFLNRRMPAYLDTGLNLVDVEDARAGICWRPSAA